MTSRRRLTQTLTCLLVVLTYAPTFVPQQRGSPQTSITVTETLSPEELEDSRINQIYQDAYRLQERHECEGAIEKYDSTVIPLADSSKFEVSRSKFLFLAL